jgi:signal transduction histidine kinase
VEQADRTAIDSQEALRKIRGHWLSHAVHEMRGPLFAARGYTKLLLDERGGEVTVTQRKYLLTILENINKLAVSVNGLQELSSQEELNLELLDFAELLQFAVADLREREKTLQLTEHIVAGPAPTAGDRAKLSFAVHKLLGTMVEFSRSGGKIDLYARREQDEFLMRISAAANGSADSSDSSVLPDLARPCEILRLHGGVASADCPQPGICNVTVRLPLICVEQRNRVTEFSIQR